MQNNQWQERGTDDDINIGIKTRMLSSLAYEVNKGCWNSNYTCIIGSHHRVHKEQSL